MSAKQMLVGLKWSVLGRLFSQAITWTLTLIIIRILTPHDYGVLAMAQSVLVFAFTLNELGMGSSIVQRPTVEEWEIGALNSFFLLLNWRWSRSFWPWRPSPAAISTNRP